jgi:hypothetical protein
MNYPKGIRKNTTAKVFILGVMNFTVALFPLYILFIFNSHAGQWDALLPGKGMPVFFCLLFWIYLFLLFFPLPSMVMSIKLKNYQDKCRLLTVNIFSFIVITGSYIWWLVFLSFQGMP